MLGQLGLLIRLREDNTVSILREVNVSLRQHILQVTRLRSRAYGRSWSPGLLEKYKNMTKI